MTAEAETGICRVVCFSPRHDLTLASLSVGALRAVVDVWVDQYLELGARPEIVHVQIFENRGAMMGASNPHPHCQVWANESLTHEMHRELKAQGEYHARHASCLLCDYAALESRLCERVVCENAHSVALVPFWAVWPFETLVVGRTGRSDAARPTRRARGRCRGE